MLEPLPRLVLAAASSGAGKTTAAMALIAALRRRGLTVAPFKCGPDYLDPTWHARAAGRPSHNLDGWMMGAEAVHGTFARTATGADVAVVEGAMGLFDGVSPVDDAGSSAELARWLEAPVVLVVDASAMARTVAAVAHGLASFDRSLRVVGVVCNRIGGRGHLDLLRAALAGSPWPVLGGLPDSPALRVPERHLGLHAAPFDSHGERDLPERAAELGEAWLDVDALLAAARGAPPMAVPSHLAHPAARAERCRIGVAWDEALHFYYEDNLARLEALGARLVRFSPIHDRALPEVDGLYLGGGYPEEHAPALAANAPMRAAIRAAAGGGMPVYAECGGLMYLARALRTLDGKEHDMAGLVPGVAAMRDGLAAIGYAEVETARETVLGRPGLRMRGHQFRHSDLVGVPEGAPRAYRVQGRAGTAPVAEGLGAGSVLASYVHVHWASCPEAAEGFVASCERSRVARRGTA